MLVKKKLGSALQPTPPLLPSVPEKLAIKDVDVSRMLGISRASVWKRHASGRLPLPVRIGRSVRWRAEEIRAWLNAGCPERTAWEKMRRLRGTSSLEGVASWGK